MSKFTRRDCMALGLTATAAGCAPRRKDSPKKSAERKTAMNWTRAFVLIAAVSLGGCGTLNWHPLGAAGGIDTAHIDKTLGTLVGSGKLVGVSALVFKDGKEAYFGAFGMADREAGRPMARDTIVQIYSMTKPITGVALMTLYEQGKFKLDDPVAKYVPELADVKVYAGTDAAGAPILVAPQRPMTIRDLARHTSGLTYGEGSNIPAVAASFDKADPMNLDNSLSEMARRLGTVPLEYSPGERWLYSRAVDVQALLVERLSGEPYAQYLHEKVLTPLGMTHTGYAVAESERDKLAAPYDRNPDGSFTRMSDQRAFDLNTKKWTLTPGGLGLASTLDDYSRFARMLLNGGELDGVRILRPETVRMMSTSQLDPAVTERSWLPSKGRVGFGIDFAVRIEPPRKTDEAAGAVGEFFWDGKFNTLFWVDPKNRLAAVLFTQYYPFGTVSLHKEFRDAVYRSLDNDAMPPP